MTRQSRDEWGLAMACTAAGRGECTRRRVGAIVLDVRGRIAGGGYNGVAAGEPSCLDGACPRGRHYQIPAGEPYDYDGWPLGLPSCACGAAWPCPNSVQPGSSYSTGPGACIAAHAELNAIMDCDPLRRQGATLYVSEQPCDGCMNAIRTSGIRRILWPDGEMKVKRKRKS